MEAQAWNNSDLGSCLCWDAETVNWCQGSNQWDQCSNYFHGLWPQAVTGALTLVFITCVVVVYMLARVTSCLVCTATLCCRKEHRANPTPVYFYRGFMLVVLCLYCVFAGVLTGYRGRVSDGLEGLNATLTAGTGVMNSRVSAFAGGALPLAQDLSVEGDVTPLVSAALDDVSRWTSDIGKAQADALRYVPLVDLFWWVLPLVFVGLLGFALVNVHRVVPEVFFFFIALAAIILCIFQANLALGGVLSNDLCTDFAGVSQQMDLIMQSKLKCGSVDGSLGEIPQTVGVLEDAYAEMAGNESGSVTDLCASYFACAAVGENSTLAEFADVFHNASQLHTGSSACTGCTIAQCVGACTAGSPAQAASAAALAFFEKVDEGVGSLVAAGYPLANCSVYQAIVADSHRPFCEGSKALSDTLPIFAGVAIGCAFLATVMVFLNALANYLYTTPPATGYEAINDGSWKVVVADDIPLIVKTNTPTPPPSGYGACKSQPTGVVAPVQADPLGSQPEKQSKPAQL